MTATYQLACPCGRMHGVTNRQAGQILRCACGADVAVPKLRDLRHLPLVEVPRSKAAGWSVGRGLVFGLGLVAFLAGATVAVLLHQRIAALTIPTEADVLQHLRDRFEEVTPTEAWDLWLNLREAAVRSRLPSPRGQAEQYKIRTTHGRNVALAVAVVGLGAMLGSLCVPGRVSSS